MRTEWIRRREFESISIDCTFRALYSLKGQARHTAPRPVHQSQALDPDKAVHALLSVKGVMGSVLSLSPIHTEGASYIRDELGRWSGEERLQVRHVATDDPSHHLLTLLGEVCPNLEYMSLDGMHLVFRYEQAFARATTASSSYLRQVDIVHSRVSSSQDAPKRQTPQHFPSALPSLDPPRHFMNGYIASPPSLSEHLSSKLLIYDTQWVGSHMQKQNIMDEKGVDGWRGSWWVSGGR